MTLVRVPLDLPFHLQEPDSCARCRHSFFEASDRKLRHMRCGLSDQPCSHERHETGSCGPAAGHWKERGV